jgi:hypothetical protein
MRLSHNSVCCHWTRLGLRQSVLPLDLPVLQQPMLPLDMYEYSSLCCALTCLSYSSLCCIWTCLSNAAFGASGLTRTCSKADLLLVFVYSIAACAASGRICPTAAFAASGLTRTCSKADFAAYFCLLYSSLCCLGTRLFYNSLCCL